MKKRIESLIIKFKKSYWWNSPLAKKIIPRSEFAKNVGILSLGTIIAQAISMVATPILSRLYKPTDYGTLSLFISIATIISSFATLGFHAAIVIPKEEEEAADITIISIIFNILFCLLSLTIILLFNNQIINLLGDPNLSNWLYLIPVMTFFLGTSLTLTSWLNRNQQYKTLSLSSILKSLTSSLSKGGLFFVLSSTSALILSTLLAEFSNFLVIGRESIKKIISLTEKGFRKRLIPTVKRYKNFLFLSLNSFLNSLSNQIIPILLVSYFTTDSTGQYSMSQSVLHLPIALFSTALNKVVYSKLGEKNRNGENLRPFIKQIALFSTLLSILIFLPILIAGPSIFSFVLGNEWYKAGVYSRILAPWLMVNFILTPITSIVNIKNAQKGGFFFNIAILITRIISIIIGGLRNDIILTMALLSITGVLFNGSYLIWSMKLSKDD